MTASNAVRAVVPARRCEAATGRRHDSLQRFEGLLRSVDRRLTICVNVGVVFSIIVALVAAV